MQRDARKRSVTVPVGCRGLKSRGQVGLTSQMPALSSGKWSRGPGAVGMSLLVGVWQNQALAWTDILTWSKLFGAHCVDFLKTSVLQQLLRPEQAATLVSPCMGLSACGFSLSTADLDRPPTQTFTSLKGALTPPPAS